MQRTARVIGLVLVTLAQSACATLFGSKTADFSLTTDPAGAKAVVDGTPVGTTPTNANLSNTKEHQVIFTKDGFSDAGCTLGKNTGAGWVVVDIVPGLLLGIIPIVVDAATGNWSQNTSHACHASLAPLATPAARPN